MTLYATLIFSLACLSMGLRIKGYNYLIACFPFFLIRRAYCILFPMQSETGLILEMATMMAVGLMLFILATIVGVGQ